MTHCTVNCVTVQWGSWARIMNGRKFGGSVPSCADTGQSDEGRGGQLWSICSATLLDSSSVSRRGETIHSLHASIMFTSSWDFIYSAGCPNQRPNIIRLLNKEIKYSPLCLLVLWIRNQGQSAAVATPLVEFSFVEIWLFKLSQNCQRMDGLYS